VRAKRFFWEQAASFEVDRSQLSLQLILMTLLHLEPLPPRTIKGEILNLLCTAGGLRREQVGRIDLQGATVAIELPDGSDARVVKALDGISFKELRLRAWRSGGSVSRADPAHRPRPTPRFVIGRSEWRLAASVDNLLERFLAGSERAVRLGHPARVLPALREHTLLAKLLAQAGLGFGAGPRPRTEARSQLAGEALGHRHRKRMGTRTKLRP
jgi:hypothetical protein